MLTLHSFHLGSKLVLERNFEPAQILEDFQRYGVTHMFGAPAMFLFLSQQPQFADTDLSSIKTLICGAAPVPESLIELWGERGVDFCLGMPGEKWGEAVTAVVALHEGRELNLEQLQG